MPLPIAPGLPPDLLLRQIYMHQSDYAVFSADMQGQVTSWNPGASLILAMPPRKCWDAARGSVYHRRPG
jgi:hypothetical protein